ncbi:hypothetical protein EB1_21890 [Empedobacter brevis NBRC 14943 = ATCC 43319]|uniref:Type IV secretion protein Rhs n=1 Tax=Empedobacter brevis NBRC 14943 = ATCC 43319 TaxID=1218108 RepID=A0A511NHW9_9FLAO|nr:RHS repeat protein [Empedobacter brevis]GEM52399.1 hypothetical protein EB1_21890 [Empedobacter brevis NBRC 14943 = ATCC 43319]
MNHGISFFRPNLGSDSTGKVIFGEQEVSSISLFTSNKKEPFKVIVTNNNGFGTYGDNFIVLKENGIWKGNYSKNQQIEGRLSSVKESNGTIINYINYTELGLERGNNFSYRIEKKLTYPYYVIPKMPRMYIVDEQSVYSSGQTKYKLFRYSDLIANFNGLGILGFGEVSQSSWIIKKGRVDNDPKQAIWSVSKFDYSKRNVETETKSVYAEIRSRGSIFSDFKVLNELNYLTTSYQYNILPDKRYILLPQSKIDKDIVSGVTTATTNTYDSYYNIATTTETKTANGQTFKTTTTNTVENLPSSNPYIIGRLKKEVSKVDAYGGSYTSQKEYTYTNNNISKTKTTVQNSGSQIIDYTYDTFGNVLTITDNGKQLSVSTTESVAARKIENIYDTNGRFVVKKKDLEGYETNLEYNLLGQVIKETDKFGAVTSTVYDNWGKLLNVTLTNSSTTPVVTQYQYARDTNGWSIISFSDQTKDYKAQYFDAVGNNIKNTIKGFSDGQYVSTSTEYDFLGRKLRESQPYFSSPSQYTTYEYDYLLRPIKVTNHTGLVATNTYEGLATTVEGTRSKKITKDAVGNTAQLVDNGTEVINYTYYPHGGVKTTTYGSHVITTNYDVWGRRTSLLDPSVSSTAYAYSYTVYDEMKEEKMPEGTTTYKYDNFGKITEKNTTGKSNISVKYTYDAAKKGLLIKEYGTNENNSFSNDITYDNFYRIANRNEVTPQFVFGKQFVYDEFGRIMNHMYGKIA